MLSFLNLSSDAIFLTSLFIVFFAATAYFGRGRIASIILAFYPATLLYTSFPFANKLLFLNGPQLLTLNKICLFLIFLTPISIIIERYIFSASEYTGSSNILKNGGLALALIILTLIFTYSIVNFDSLHDFSGRIDALFATNDRIFYWNLAPFLLLAFI